MYCKCNLILSLFNVLPPPRKSRHELEHHQIVEREGERGRVIEGEGLEGLEEQKRGRGGGDIMFMGSLHELDQLRCVAMHKVNMNTNFHNQIT